MGRSLRASKEGLEKAKAAFELKEWTQEHLAIRADCSRGTVINFFAQRPVTSKLFQTFCIELELDWGEIAELEADEVPERTLNIDELIASVRTNIYGSVFEKCGSMRVLDMSQPIGLDDIYTDVNILEKITGRRRLEISELVEQGDVENFERFGLSDTREKRVPGLQAVEQYSKLMILGKPGAGKTTFLKHLAIQCMEGCFKPKLVPFLVTLKDFAEAPAQPTLLEHLDQLLDSYGVELNTKVKVKALTTTHSKPPLAIELFVKQGRALILLDGLDEVRQSDSSRVLQQIQSFANQFHKNQFIITCRIAARNYTFEQFTEVEVADFDSEQIKAFATKWFQAKQDLVKAETFMDRLKQDKGIRELATRPILLTLLCLVFEELGTFPANRSELYKEGLDVLLKKWDVKRNIERDQAYKKLSLKRKEDLLSQIAIDTFYPGNYFFKQKEVEREINDYIRNLPGANIEEEALQLDSEAVLKSIEAQHGLLVERARGIYSFSHLTFHEYFTARKLVASSKSNIFSTQLFPHLYEKRWREVFLLTVSMIESADELLLAMKQQIDELIGNDDEIQQFLSWVEEKSHSVNISCKPSAVRAFYFSFARAALSGTLVRSLDLDRNLDRALDRTFSLDLDRALDLAFSLDLDRSLDRVLSLDISLDLDSALIRLLDLVLDSALSLILDSALSLSRVRSRDLGLALSLDQALSRDLVFAYTLTCNLALAPGLEQPLQILKDCFPDDSPDGQKTAVKWWKISGIEWIEQLRIIMVEHRSIGHNWQFNDKQQAMLRQYYIANQLLVDCLNSDCYVSREVRQEIETGLLLPTRKGN